MKILGIDPGLADTGWALVNFKNNKITLEKYGCLKTNKNLDYNLRLKNIFDEINQLIAQYNPKILALEALFFAKNAKTATKVGQAIGAIKLAGIISGLKIYEYTPLNVKMTICGYGRADKKQIEYMVGKILSLKKKITPSHSADALAVCLTYCYTNKKLK